jgi:hypothetical protein
MITFLSQQSNCARHVRKNENADTVNFTSQIASSICTVTFTKRVKPDATIFKSRCSRTVVCYRFDRVSGKDAALPPRPPLRTGREGCPFIRLKPLQNSA